MMQTRTILLARRSLLARAGPLTRGFATSIRLRECPLQVGDAVLGAGREQVLLPWALSMTWDQHVNQCDGTDTRASRKCAKNRCFTTGGGA